MSYATVLYSQWTSPPDNTKYRVDLQKSGFAGTARRISSTDNFFDHNYQSLNIKEPHKTPVLKSDFTHTIVVESQADIDILEDILSSPQGTYRAVKSVNDVAEWTGDVDAEQISYNRSPFPYNAKIVARDLDFQRGKDYLFTDERRRIIDIIASVLPYSLPIHAYTLWKEGTMTESQDFLNECYIDRFALRQYGRAGGEEDEQISQFEAIERIMANFRCFIYQAGNKWMVFQLSAMKDANNIREFVYNSAGVYQSTSLKDITIDIDSNDRYLLRSTMIRGMKSYKQARVRFDHRTTVQGIKFPSLITLPGGTAVYSEFFNGDGNQRLYLTGTVYADENITDPIGTTVTAQADITIRAGSLYWDGAEWTETVSSVSIQLNTEVLGPPVQSYVGFINIQTALIPDGTGPDIEITLGQASRLATLEETRYQGLNRIISNPAVAEGNSTAIDYLLTQTADKKSRYDAGNMWFGTGPAFYARSAITRDAAGDVPTATTWFYPGGDIVEHANILLREILDLQRGNVRGLDVDLFGGYSPKNVLSFDGSYHVFLGGSQSGKDNKWRANVLTINVSTSATDTFEILYKTSGDEATGTQASGGGGGGLTTSTADSRYLRRTQNLNDLSNVATARENLGLGNLATLDQVNTAHIVNGAVTNDKLAVDAVSTTRILNDAVTFAKMQDIAGLSVIGRSGTDTANPESIVASNDHEILRRSGTALGFGKIGHESTTFANQDLLTTASPTFANLTLTGNATISGAVAHPSFSPSFDGSNYRILADGTAELKSLLIRENLRAREFIIDQISVIGGTQIISPARGKIATVDVNQDTITLEDPNGRNANTFVDGDLFAVRSIDIDGANIKFVTGSVAVASGITLQLSPAGVTGNLAPGDVIVQRGHPTNTARQSLIYQTAVGTNAPYTRYYSGLDSLAGFSDNDYVIAQSGNLNDLTSTYPAVDGDGVFSARLFATKSVLIGDLTKTQGYLSFEDDEFDLDAVKYQLHAVGMDINSEGTGIPDASVHSTGSDGVGHNFLSDPVSSWKLAVTDITRGKVLRFWANIYTAVSTAHQPNYRLVIQGRVPAGTWANIDHTDMTFPLIGDEYGDNQNWNFEVDAFTNYTQFRANNSTTGQHGIYAVIYLYPQGDFTEYRFRVERIHTQSTGTSELVTGSAVQRRVYNRKTTVQQDGFYLVDADIIKREYNALTGDTLITDTGGIILN